jgi:3-oxoacyl-[acyl-carrier-protein] synthase-3
VDAFVFHQGSRNIVETVAKRLAVPMEKVRFCASDYGNTVSSSIPMILADEISRPEVRTILISGFGVGFSWSSTVLTRRS